jgi:hypothetical protein
MGKMLVELDLFEGLPTKIEIEWRGMVIQQKLDYMGVPFRCSVCKETGHLRHNCSGNSKKVALGLTDMLDEAEVKMQTSDMKLVSEDWIENLKPSALDSELVTGKLNHLCLNL